MAVDARRELGPEPPWEGRRWELRSALRAARRAQEASRRAGRDPAEKLIRAGQALVLEGEGQFTVKQLADRAGVALQTFYRIFAGKDQLLLAVLENMIAESCVAYEEAAAGLPDPVARLRYYVTATITGLDAAAPGIGPRFVTAEHWRLHELFPDEMTHATQHFTDLVARQLELATAEGLLASDDPQRDAWFVTKLVMAVFHHYAFADSPPDARAVGDDLWDFCHRALGGAKDGL